MTEHNQLLWTSTTKCLNTGSLPDADKKPTCWDQVCPLKKGERVSIACAVNDAVYWLTLPSAENSSTWGGELLYPRLSVHIWLWVFDVFSKPPSCGVVHNCSNLCYIPGNLITCRVRRYNNWTTNWTTQYHSQVLSWEAPSRNFYSKGDGLWDAKLACPNEFRSKIGINRYLQETCESHTNLAAKLYQVKRLYCIWHMLEVFLLVGGVLKMIVTSHQVSCVLRYETLSLSTGEAE